jgi:hypothetical protein
MSLSRQLYHQVGSRVRHAGQYKAVALFLRAQAWPVDAVCDLAATELANAGAAGAVTAGAGQLQARYASQLGSLQQAQVGGCFEDQTGGSHPGGKNSIGALRQRFGIYLMVASLHDLHATGLKREKGPHAA